MENAGAYHRGGKCRSRSHAWKMQEWKMRESNAGVENAGATKYGKPAEENTLKCQMKYGCRGFHAFLLADI